MHASDRALTQNNAKPELVLLGAQSFEFVF